MNPIKPSYRPHKGAIPPGMVKAKARISVVNLVFHQPQGGKPLPIESRYSRSLDSEEQPYVRSILVGMEWKPLDVGWSVEWGEQGCGLLILQNEEEKGKDRKVIEVCPSTAPSPTTTSYSWFILPGETMMGQPNKPDLLHVRCLNGPARLMITLLPR